MDDVLTIARQAGNVGDLGSPGAAADGMKSLLAERISRALKANGRSLRDVAEKTGFAAADLSRIRRSNLGRFTVDRLLAILSAVEPGIELTLIVRPKITREWAVDALGALEGEIRNFGVTGLYLFGSAVRNEAGTESDLDVLIDRPPDFPILNIVSLAGHLEEKLGVHVHVSDHQTLKPELRNAIERDAVRIF